MNRQEFELRVLLDNLLLADRCGRGMNDWIGSSASGHAIAFINDSRLSEVVIKMMGLRLAAVTAAFAVLFSVSQAAPVLAEDAAPQADVVGSASSPSHKSPIHVKVVDYQKAEDGPGTLKMSGMAIPGQDVVISVDDKPFAKVTPADDGSWDVEDKIPLDESVHAVRVQQFDKTTQMPAATAMFSMSLAPPSAADLAAPPPR